MKKMIFLALLGLLAGWTTSCVDDESSMGSVDAGMGNAAAGVIVIEGIYDEDTLDVNSYLGTNLKDVISPKVTSDYPEEDLEYAWYLFEADGSEGYYKDFPIASGLEPDYEINLPTGLYTVVFEVTCRSNGYVKLATTRLSAATSFARGYYILKETPDGQTEVDVYSESALQSDLMAGMTGAPLLGKPRNLVVFYDGEFINPDTNEPDGGNLVHVMTEDNIYKGFRAEDLCEVFNNDNLFYEGPMPADEAPATFLRTWVYCGYISNTGVRYAELGMQLSGPANTGKMGFSEGDGGSRFVVAADGHMGYVYWSPTAHKLIRLSYNLDGVSPVEFLDANDQVVPDAYPSDLECLSAGTNYLAGSLTSYFLCEQPATGDRYLFLLSSSSKIDRIVKLDPSLHLAKATSFSANGWTAAYIYCVDGGKVYAYGLNDGKERELSLPGIPGGEEVVFVSNQYLNFEGLADDSYAFDDLIVGTQVGDTYKLYIYGEDQTSTGVPVAEPRDVVAGTGRVKSVRYMAPVSLDGFMMMMMMNPYPMSD